MRECACVCVCLFVRVCVYLRQCYLTQNILFNLILSRSNRLHLELKNKRKKHGRNWERKVKKELGTDLNKHCNMVQNNHESKCQYWATRSSFCSFTCTDCTASLCTACFPCVLHCVHSFTRSHSAQRTLTPELVGK